jgi:transcriptional regulator with XRE-family HTH domain
MIKTSINGVRVYKLRLEKGWSQDDLAFEMRRVSGGALKTNAQQISRIETGKTTDPRGKVVAVLAAALGVSRDELYASDEDEEPRAVVLRRAAEAARASGDLISADVLFAAAAREAGVA